MNYYTITEFLSDKLGIPNEFFELNFEFPEEREYINIDKKDIPNHYFLSSYEYCAKTGEDWKSIILFFPKAVEKEILSVLNEYLKAHNEDLIAENNPDNYALNQDNFNLILVQSNDRHLKVEIALKE